MRGPKAAPHANGANAGFNEIHHLPPQRGLTAKESRKRNSSPADSTPDKATAGPSKNPSGLKTLAPRNAAWADRVSGKSVKETSGEHHVAQASVKSSKQGALQEQIRRDVQEFQSGGLDRDRRDASVVDWDYNNIGWPQNRCKTANGCVPRPADFDPSVGPGPTLECISYSNAGDNAECTFQQAVSKVHYDIGTGGLHIEYKQRNPLDGRPNPSFIAGGVFAQEVVPLGTPYFEGDLFEVWGSQNSFGKNNVIRFNADGSMTQDPRDIVGIDMTQAFTTTVDITPRKANGMYDITFNYFQGADVPKSTRTVTDVRIDTGKLQIRVNAWAVQSGLWNGDYAPGDCHFRIGPVQVRAVSNSSIMSDGSSSTNILGPVLGGVLGGVAVLVLIGGILFQAYRRNGQIRLRERQQHAGGVPMEVVLHRDDQRQVAAAAARFRTDVGQLEEATV